MLRTRRDDDLWFITQPDHGALAGYLAAHWGNDELARPGDYAPTADPRRLRAEAILAIAQHDNGWWEWEAAPSHADDGLPADLSAVLADRNEAMQRWRLGIPRLADAHPYAALLIAFHAHWLYAPQAHADCDPAYLHPLFGPRMPQPASGADAHALAGCLAEIDDFRRELSERVRRDPVAADWLDAAHQLPHGRLLQVLDAFSLYLCAAIVPTLAGPARGQGADDVDLPHVPRRSATDRVTLELRSAGDRRVRVSPYPFDAAPLRATVPAKRLPAASMSAVEAAERWQHAPTELLEFTLVA